MSDVDVAAGLQQPTAAVAAAAVSADKSSVVAAAAAAVSPAASLVDSASDSSAALPLRNTDPKFVGIDGMKSAHAKQLARFRKWVSNKQFSRLHDAHYDWWMFPINLSSGHGLAYTCYAEEIAALRSDAVYMANWREGVRLLTFAWGWDIASATELPRAQRSVERGQCWQNWPVRLYKATLSARLFDEQALFRSLRAYGRLLLSRGQKFRYGGHDLSPLFTEQ
jgi:hypothetical protein